VHQQRWQLARQLATRSGEAHGQPLPVLCEKRVTPAAFLRSLRRLQREKYKLPLYWITHMFTRKTFLRLAATILLAPVFSHAAPATGEPIWFGVSGPLTGQNAQYGAQWKAGFDLALDDINSKGGIHGRPLTYVFEDSQSDPRQAVGLAQKFVNDPRIKIELGDFSSPASMAASPIYQRAGLVQLGFTNSHPDFTKGGDYIWSPSVSQADSQPLLADLAIKTLGFKKVAVLFLNTDWGRTSRDVFVKAAEARGAQVVIAEGYQPDEKDFRSTLVRVRDANPDGLVLISYYPDGALIASQVRSVGLKQQIAAAGSVYSPKFLELGGAAVEWHLHQHRLLPGGAARRRCRASSAASRPNTAKSPTPSTPMPMTPCRSRSCRIESRLARRATAGRARCALQTQGRAQRRLRQGELRPADAPRHRRQERADLVVKDGKWASGETLKCEA
jgi:ABC-type branched-subunit amino acid transport system substrate-binding protein